MYSGFFLSLFPKKVLNLDNSHLILNKSIMRNCYLGNTIFIKSVSDSLIEIIDFKVIQSVFETENFIKISNGNMFFLEKMIISM